MELRRIDWVKQAEVPQHYVEGQRFRRLQTVEMEEKRCVMALLVMEMKAVIYIVKKVNEEKYAKEKKNEIGNRGFWRSTSILQPKDLLMHGKLDL